MTEEEIIKNLDLPSDEAQPDANTNEPELGTEGVNHTPENDFIQEEESSAPPVKKKVAKSPPMKTTKNSRGIPENPNIERDYDKTDLAPCTNALHRIMRETDRFLWNREKLILQALEKGIHASYRIDWRNTANQEFRRIVFLNLRRKRYKHGKIA